jgi:CRISPR-associated protein Csx17
MSNEVMLNGCAPAPLIHYLKALGVLRLVAEQFDPQVRGSWHGDAFMLITNKTGEDIVRFFLDQYRPSPIVAPWNGGSGFYAQDKNQSAMIEALSGVKTARLDNYRSTIAVASAIVANREVQPRDEEKTELLRRARREFPDCALAWLDAAFVLGLEKPDYPPLLGSGGNDGRLDFTINFIARLLSVLPEAIQQEANAQLETKSSEKRLDETKRAKLKERLAMQSEAQIELSKRQLLAALFRDRVATLTEAAVGQFYPAGAGGVNATQGVSGGSYVNPWDFILAMEGTLILANATVRRLSAGARSRASFPFTTRNSAVGYGSATSNEKVRAEIWLPLWSRPAGYAEIAHIFGEGRVQYGQSRKRIAQTGFDFARAVAELGVDRGIEAFQRYAFIERNGQANLATTLGLFEVRERPRASYIYEVDRWLEDLRRATSDTKRTPPRFTRLRAQIEESIFSLCVSGEAEHLRDTLVALGAAECEIGRSLRFRSEHESLRPLANLSFGWAKECDDNSHEFVLAAALASIGGSEKRAPFRVHLESVAIVNGSAGWTSDDAAAIWGSGSLAENLASTLHRRSIDARSAGESHPALAAAQFAPLEAIDAFLRGETDDVRIEEFLRGLALIDWRTNRQEEQASGSTIVPTLPRAYALLKLLFLPEGRLCRGPASEVIEIKHEPTIIPLLRAGRITEGLHTAAQRLRATGLTPLTDQFYFPAADGARLAAALLIPISQRSIRALADLTLREETNAQ